MNIEKFEELNSVYKPIYELTKSIIAEMEKNSYKCEWGYFGHHYIRHNNNWLEEYFPIPVINVNGSYDIGIDLEHIFIEYKMLKQTALKYDFNKLTKYKFEVYGIENFLNDFYNAELDLNSIKSRILESEEKEIGISIFLDKELYLEHIVNSVKDIESCYIETIDKISKTSYSTSCNRKLDYFDIIGKTVSGTIDRPLFSVHPKHRHLKYYVNYGYADGIMAADNSEQDIYLLGIDEPVKTFEGIVIAVIHRKNDIEDKWIVAPKGMNFTDEEILRSVMFQEKFFDIELYR